MEFINVTLPTGFSVENKWYRNATLCPLDGAKEEAVREIAVLLPVERTTILLTRGLKILGPKSVITDDDVRSLTVGDRDALLLHLRYLAFGDKIQSIVTCPSSSCREKMDIEFTIREILVPPNRDAKERYEVNIKENGNDYRLKFRLPTGADQEAIVKLAQCNPDNASKLLLERCIQEIKENGHKIKFLNKVPIEVFNSISKHMAELDPQAEILFNLACPSCKHNFLAHFDIGDYFFKELMAHSQQLYREVHVLAFHYHWSEQEILNMSRAKRQIYLGLLEKTLNSEQI